MPPVLGWVLFGVACLRARAFPVAAYTAVLVTAVVGYGAVLPPYGSPLG